MFHDALDAEDRRTVVDEHPVRRPVIAERDDNVVRVHRNERWFDALVYGTFV